MNQFQIRDFYNREDIQEVLLALAKDRETVGVYRNGAFGKRPNVILYPNDISEMVKTGIIEFHTSIERWKNPMALKQGNYDELRSGWDLILDIDCKDFIHAKTAAIVISNALKKHGIKSLSIKFTGGKGFHIGVPWDSMPKEIDFKPTVKQYPDLARKMGLYMKQFIRQDLAKSLLKKQSPEEISTASGVPLGKILTDTGIDQFSIIEIDPVLISPRHLFRAAYSLNAKSFLVSLPLKQSQLEDFTKEDARPEKISVKEKFLGTAEPNEASALLAETIDWWEKNKKTEARMKKREIRIEGKIPPELFPPCVKSLSIGLSDGRKRSVLILTNFLLKINWSWQDIETYILKWNKKNKPPLAENYIRGQIRWHKNRKESVLPPNCDNLGYYKGIGICMPDDLCKQIKNPVHYSVKKIPKKPEKPRTTKKPTN